MKNNLNAADKLLALMLGNETLVIDKKALDYCGIKKQSVYSQLSRLRTAGYDIQYLGAQRYRLRGEAPKGCPHMQRICTSYTDEQGLTPEERRELGKHVGGSMYITDEPEMPELITKESAPALYRLLNQSIEEGQASGKVVYLNRKHVVDKYREAHGLKTEDTGNPAEVNSISKCFVFGLKVCLLLALCFYIGLIFTLAFFSNLI